MDRWGKETPTEEAKRSKLVKPETLSRSWLWRSNLLSKSKD
jgi:hypothetical protein